MQLTDPASFSHFPLHQIRTNDHQSYLLETSADASDWSIEAFLVMMRATIQNYSQTLVTFVSIDAVLKRNYKKDRQVTEVEAKDPQDTSYFW